MATIITVHGTFSHAGGEPQTEAASRAEDIWWWQPESSFARDIQSMVQGEGTAGAPVPVKIEPFVWSGENSEVGRRVAGSKLLDWMVELETRNEPYCVVGHSHGGSVIAAALIDSLARKVELRNMKRWVTIGTPFVSMRPKFWLVDRLNLMQKVVLVASMMLLLMFLMALAGQILGDTSTSSWMWQFGATDPRGSGNGPWRLALAALIMSVPTLLFSVLFRVSDHKRLSVYRQPTIDAARSAFGPKWLSLVHKDDEAVQGLRSLPRASVQLFDKSFAVQRLTILAVFAMPLAYLLVLKSPTLMVGVANFLKNDFYQVDPARAQAFEVDRSKIRLRASTARTAAKDQSAEWAEIRHLRDSLRDKYQDYSAIERHLRFNREFFQQNRQPCPGNVLCGYGQNFAINSRLLFHLVTDDLTSAVVNDDIRYGSWGGALRATIPMVVVPALFISLALIAMYIIGLLAHAISAVLAYLLNRVTLDEIKRTIYGNDTNGEIAIGGGPRPPWIPTAPQFLPAEVANPITDFANQTTAASLAKFRNALSTIALAEGQPRDSNLVSNYLTWKELIHTAYFELPQFRRLLARSISEVDGFRASATFAADPGYLMATDWLTRLHSEAPAQQIGSAAPPSGQTASVTTGAANVTRVAP
jgi:hypothetical protein